MTSRQYKCTYQIWWKSFEIYLSYWPESKIWMYCGQITLSNMKKKCPLAIPKQISTIPMQIPSLVKIHWYLLKLPSINENTDLSRADNSVKNWRNLLINNPKPNLYNINTHNEFCENPLIFTQVIVWKRIYRQSDGRTTDWRTFLQIDTYWNKNWSNLCDVYS